MEYLIKKSRLEVSLCFQTGLAYYLKGLLLLTTIYRIAVQP